MINHFQNKCRKAVLTQSPRLVISFHAGIHSILLIFLRYFLSSGLLQQDSFTGLSKLHSLILRRCRIHTIESNAFRSLAALRTLDLTWNLIRHLESYAFSGLPGLRTLTLDYNHLVIIYSYAFHGLDLTRLSLEANPDLHTITSDAFNDSRVQELNIYNTSLRIESLTSLTLLKDSLRQLSIIHNTRPLEIHETLFKGFTFQSLKLENCGLQDTSFLRHISVEELSLSGNVLNDVTFSRFQNLNTIRVLRLDNTGLTEINVTMFKGMSRLEQLYLSDNSITTISETLRGVVSRLNVLALDGNPLHCNCRLSWFHRWIRATSARVMAGRCESPMSELLSKVSVVELMCSPPHVLTITKSINAAAHHEVSLICTAHGDPTPAIIWKTPVGNDIIAAPAPVKQKSGQNRGVLTIPAIREEDAGNYECVAANVAGNASNVAVLDVYNVLPRTFHNDSQTIQCKYVLYWPLLFILCMLSHL